MLALPLLVLGVRADDAHDAGATNDLALLADALHRRSDLHGSVPILTRDAKRAVSTEKTTSRAAAMARVPPDVIRESGTY